LVDAPVHDADRPLADAIFEAIAGDLGADQRVPVEWRHDAMMPQEKRGQAAFLSAWPGLTGPWSEKAACPLLSRTPVCGIGPLAMQDPTLAAEALALLPPDVGASPLFSADLAPVPPKRRTWNTYAFAALWISMCHCIPTYTLAGGMIAAGMSWWQALL